MPAHLFSTAGAGAAFRGERVRAMRATAAMLAKAAATGLGLCALPAMSAEVPAADAARHVGEVATVCGVVASAKFDSELPSQPTFLDFEKAYPDQVFTVVIFGGDRGKFGTPETTLRGKRVCVTGKIQQKSGMPEIILNDPKQLTR
jgi:hypothetical protein